MVGVVPLASLKIHAIDVATILRLLLDVLVGAIVLDVEGEVESIDGDLVLSRVVLEGTSEEGLGEEETRDPEHSGGSMLDPICQEEDTVIKILDPRGEGLEREEALVLPALGYEVVKDGVSHLFELLTHDDFSLECHLHVDKTNLHVSKKAVVADALLEEDGVHRLLIRGGEFLANHLKVNNWRGLGLDIGSLLAYDLLSCLSTAR